MTKFQKLFQRVKQIKTGRYKYKGELVKQVEEYQGFYISRYEAGRKDGVLASQEGLETVNMVTYAQAKRICRKNVSKIHM